MDQAQDQLTKEFKESVYKEIIDAMVIGLKNGEMYEKDSDESASFILDGMEKVTNKSGLIALLEVLSKRWEVYRPVYLKYKSEQLINKIEGELSQLSNTQ